VVAACDGVEAWNILQAPDAPSLAILDWVMPGMTGPGFYRVALAVNSRDELPPDPEVKTESTANGPRSVSASIHYPPAPPVLADGLFPHTSKMDKEVETDVDIPNINCSKCTLQIVEFMAAHGLNKDGDYTYHHCAVLQIRANPDKPIDARFPAEKK
jgi:hypothetical protein